MIRNLDINAIRFEGKSMTNEVYCFGDSHWRVFFPFVNHGSPGVFHELNGVTMIDMVANELSGATMYGLVNKNSTNGANRRIIGDLEKMRGVDNVALVFGEVDVRYHNHFYFKETGELDSVAVLKTLLRYKAFIEELFDRGLVSKNVFVYYGFAYPHGENTLLQPGINIGERLSYAERLHMAMAEMIAPILQFAERDQRVHVIINQHSETGQMVSNDGVHLEPEKIFPLIHTFIASILLDQPQSGMRNDLRQG